MDQLNMNNVKHHEKINTHTQITKNNNIQRSGLLFFFSKKQYVRPSFSLPPENRGRERVEKGGRARVPWERPG